MFFIALFLQVLGIFLQVGIAWHIGMERISVVGFLKDRKLLQLLVLESINLTSFYKTSGRSLSNT